MFGKLFTFKMTAEDRRQLEDLAKARGEALSVTLRLLVREAYAKLTPQNRASIRHGN